MWFTIFKTYMYTFISILRSFAYDNIVLLVGQGERAGPTGARDAETKGEDRDVEGGEEKEGEAWSFLEDVHEHNYPVIEIRREALLEFITIKCSCVGLGTYPFVFVFF